jgi:hypothetical protein
MKANQHTKDLPNCSKFVLWYVIWTKNFKPYYLPNPNIATDESFDTLEEASVN